MAGGYIEAQESACENCEGDGGLVGRNCGVGSV